MAKIRYVYNGKNGFFVDVIGTKIDKRMIGRRVNVISMVCTDMPFLPAIVTECRINRSGGIEYLVKMQAAGTWLDNDALWCSLSEFTFLPAP